MWQKLKNKIQGKIEFLTIKQKLHLGFGAVLGFMVIIILINLISLFMIRSNTNEIIEEHTPTVFAALELESELKNASSALGFYLLSQESIHKSNYIAATKKIDELLAILHQQKTIKNDGTAYKYLLKIQESVTHFKTYQEKMINLVVSPATNYPGVQYSTAVINPISQQILQYLYIMIASEKQEQPSVRRKKLLMTITDLRYRWTLIMSGIRGYLALRSEPMLKELESNREIADNLIDELNRYKNIFTFEQDDALENIQSLLKSYSFESDKMFKIHKSEKWRQDAHLIRTEIGPLLLATNSQINELVTHQQKEIDTANTTLVSLIATIMVVSLIILGVAIIIASRIVVRLINDITDPLNNAVKATDLIRTGDLSVSLNDSAHDEVGQLGRSFNLMVQKFQADIEAEKKSAEALEEKVYLIAGVVELAAKGDLTGTLSLSEGDDFIATLEKNVQTMLNNLNDLVSQVQRSGIQVTSSTTEIAATAKQQEATVTEQAATANEISTTAQEISATSQELTNTMGDVTQAVESTANEAANSQVALNEMESTMQKMMEATSNISTKLSVLSEKAANINSVVTTITKVADQTNLLSLNAAIEAEKAGEYGAGFSVVATEIRRLADQTAVATWDIEQMVKEMQTAVTAGVMGMDKFSEEVRGGVNDVQQVGSQLADIIEAVQVMLPSIEAVHEGMQNQSTGAQQINESISQLSEGTQQTADSLRQSGGALSQLNDAARSLQSGVSKFKVKSA